MMHDAAGDDDEARPPLGAQFEALFAAGSGLLAALRRFLSAWGALLGAEARVLRTGLPLFFIGTIALVAFSVSLWACVVALLGWLLLKATHSAGIALLLLVLGHAALVVGIWFAIKRGARQASFPKARAEWRSLRHQLAEDIERLAQAPRADNAHTAGDAARPDPERQP